MLHHVGWPDDVVPVCEPVLGDDVVQARVLPGVAPVEGQQQAEEAVGVHRPPSLTELLVSQVLQAGQRDELLSGGKGEREEV